MASRSGEQELRPAGAAASRSCVGKDLRRAIVADSRSTGQQERGKQGRRRAKPAASKRCSVEHWLRARDVTWDTGGGEDLRRWRSVEEKYSGEVRAAEGKGDGE